MSKSHPPAPPPVSGDGKTTLPPGKRLVAAPTDADWDELLEALTGESKRVPEAEEVTREHPPHTLAELEEVTAPPSERPHRRLSLVDSEDFVDAEITRIGDSARPYDLDLSDPEETRISLPTPLLLEAASGIGTGVPDTATHRRDAGAKSAWRTVAASTSEQVIAAFSGEREQLRRVDYMLSVARTSEALLLHALQTLPEIHLVRRIDAVLELIEKATSTRLLAYGCHLAIRANRLLTARELVHQLQTRLRADAPSTGGQESVAMLETTVEQLDAALADVAAEDAKSEHISALRKRLSEMQAIANATPVSQHWLDTSLEEDDLEPGRFLELAEHTTSTTLKSAWLLRAALGHEAETSRALIERALTLAPSDPVLQEFARRNTGERLVSYFETRLAAEKSKRAGAKFDLLREHERQAATAKDPDALRQALTAIAETLAPAPEGFAHVRVLSSDSDADPDWALAADSLPWDTLAETARHDTLLAFRGLDHCRKNGLRARQIEIIESLLQGTRLNPLDKTALMLDSLAAFTGEETPRAADADATIPGNTDEAWRKRALELLTSFASEDSVGGIVWERIASLHAGAAPERGLAFANAAALAWDDGQKRRLWQAAAACFEQSGSIAGALRANLELITAAPQDAETARHLRTLLGTSALSVDPLLLREAEISLLRSDLVREALSKTDRIRALTRLADLQRDDGDTEAYRQTLRRLTDEDPTARHAYKELTLIALRLGDWTAAADAAIRFAKCPDVPPVELAWAFTTLGELYAHHLPDPKRALAALGRAVKLDPTRRDALALLFTLARDQGDQATMELHRASALQAVRTALLASPGDPLLWQELEQLLSDVAGFDPDALESLACTFGARPNTTTKAKRPATPPRTGGPELLSSELVSALKFAGELVTRALPLEPKALGFDRLTAKEHPFSQATIELGKLTSVSIADIWLCASPPRACYLADGKTAALVLGRELLTQSSHDARLFLLVRAATARALGLSWIERVGADTAEAVILTLLAAAEPGGVAPLGTALSPKQQDALVRLLPPRERHEWGPTLLELRSPRRPVGASLLSTLHQLTSRAALATLRAPEESFKAMAALGGEVQGEKQNAQDRVALIAKYPPAKELLEYALSDAFLRTNAGTSP